MDPSVESIVALRPDLVLVATSANAQRSVDLLGRAGVPVYVSRADSLEAIYADITGIGEALDRGAEAARLVASLRARVAAVHALVATTPPTSAAVIVWPSPLTVAARGSHVGDLVEAAGGRNVVTETMQPYPAYSTERLVRLAPQVLIVGTHAEGAPPLDALNALASIPAVHDHRVHLVDGDLLFRPGPRVIDGIEALVPLFHPELGVDGGSR
jgi:iron complex transport system substrate-binding protein